jgi:hypothetical protein
MQCHQRSFCCEARAWPTGSLYQFNFENRPVPFPATLPHGCWQLLLDSADPVWFGPGNSFNPS